MQEKIEVIKSQFQGLSSKKRELGLQVEEKEELSEKIRIAVSDLQEEEEGLQLEMRDSLKKKYQNEREVRSLETLKNNEIEKQKRIKADILKISEEKQRLEANASAYCHRVQVTKTASEIEKQIHLLHAKLRERGEDANDPEYYMQKYKEQSELIEKIKFELNLNQNVCDEMQAALKMRHLKWHDFRQHIAIRSNCHFGWSMNQRGYTGSLNYNHEKKNLEVKIQNSESNKAGNTSTLSGGERSFGTISFLLSLWEAMSTPLLCLDEFDVFMDSVNRNEIIKMILDFASKTNIQYILITPQSMSSISTNDAKIIRLRDPERGQTTIN